MPQLVKEIAVTKTATVQAIDMKTRKVTLKDKDGNVWDLIVDENVKNLPQVKVGDEVLTKYYESVVVQIANPETPLGVTSTDTSTVAKPGDKPAGTETNQVTVVATIVTIDPGKTFVTLKGPEGKAVNVKVKDPKNLDNVKVGDKVSITYTQALAISVQAAEIK
jgi:Cu/Ag efflux protein CusF